LQTTTGAAPRSRPRLEALEDRTVPAGGVLDPTFGTGGVVNSSLGATTRAYAVATYPQEGTANDGKIVVAGIYTGPSKKSQFGVVRYNLDGSLDKSFGGSGEVAGPGSWALDVLVQPDGKVVAAGDSNGDFAVARYNADGSLDKTFGNSGVALTNIASNSFDRIYAIALQTDGKIVAVGGTTPPNSSSREMALVRYNANGTLDTTFGKGGMALDHIATSPLEGGATRNFGLTIDRSTDQIIVEAASLKPSPAGYDAMVIRYTSTGALDKSFAGTGHETFDGAGLPALIFKGGLAVQPGDHRILVAGQLASGDGTMQGLARLNPDGPPDGSLKSTNTRDVGQVDTVQLQPDGRILVGTTGSVTFGNGNTLTVARYNSDLSPDTSFGTGGVAGVPNSSGLSGQGFADMALEPDGRVVVTGWPMLGTWKVIVARFLATGPQIGSLTASPPAGGGSVMLTAANVTDGNPGAKVTQVAFSIDSNDDGVLDAGDTQLVGTLTQSNGTWTLTFSTAGWAPGTYRLFAQAVDSYDVFGDPLALDLQVV
jgi:uncharacterized delta-60 repeat protein